MGKRTIAAFVLGFATLTSTIGGLAGPAMVVSHEGLAALKSLVTRAQEIPVSYASAAPLIHLVGSDSFRERVVIFRPQLQREATHQFTVWATGYSSDLHQTDETPFVTASGSSVHDGIAAANFLPLGTEFRLPEKFGSKIFVVEDRMNERFDDQQIVDLWFETRGQAQSFGKRMLTLEVL